jgi:hypothetical protein
VPHHSPGQQEYYRTAQAKNIQYTQRAERTYICHKWVEDIYLTQSLEYLPSDREYTYMIVNPDDYKTESEKKTVGD